MFSGKSTALLTRAAALTAEGRSVVLVKPERDTRYAQNLLVTHAGKAARCLRVPRLEDLPRALGRERWAQLDVVVVDEGQFFDDLIEFAVAASEGLSDGDDNDEIAERSATTTTVRPKAVIVAGLSGDFRRRPFGRVAELLPLADSVRALRARCFSCGGQAPFSLRLCGEAAQVLVGGPEAYRPACRACFSRHQQSSKKEAP
jgi:thymidine kinase